jgi:hypothetical protein
LFEDHVIGEFLGFSGIKLSTLNLKVSRIRSELENLIALFGDLGSRERNKGTNSWGRSDKREELGVKKLNGISFSRKVSVKELLRDGKGLLGGWVLSTFESLTDGEVTTFEVRDGLLSNNDHVSLDSGSLKFIKSALSFADDERVVSSAKTTISGNANNGYFLNLTLGEKWDVSSVSSHAANKSSENRLKSLRERAGSDNGVLCATDLGSSNKLHGRSNLLGVLNGLNAITDG